MTHDDYLQWLIGELEAIGRPVHLFGHDWGGLHVLGVAVQRPDLLLSWTCDVAGILAPDYTWHPLASSWQEQPSGEEQIRMMIDVPTGKRVQYLCSHGMPGPVAKRLAPELSDPMGECILALYRSAIQPAMELIGESVERAAARPGVVVVAGQDHNSGTQSQHLLIAERAQASCIFFPDLGHWWFAQAPLRAAEALQAHWAT